MHFLRRIVVAASPQAHSAHHLRMRARLMNIHTHTHTHLLATTANNLPHNGGSSSCQQRFNCSKLKATIHKRPLTAAVNVAVSGAVDVSLCVPHALALSPSLSPCQRQIAVPSFAPRRLFIDSPSVGHVLPPYLSLALPLCPSPFPPTHRISCHARQRLICMLISSSSATLLQLSPTRGCLFLISSRALPAARAQGRLRVGEGAGWCWGCLQAISRQKFHELISVLHVVIY